MLLEKQVERLSYQLLLRNPLVLRQALELRQRVLVHPGRERLLGLPARSLDSSLPSRLADVAPSHLKICHLCRSELPPGKFSGANVDLRLLRALQKGRHFDRPAVTMVDMFHQTAGRVRRPAHHKK